MRVIMIELFEKRGKWCYRTADGKIHKFATKEEAMRLGLGIEDGCSDCGCDPCQCDDEDELDSAYRLTALKLKTIL